jgi:hypothetical protein
MQLTVERCQNTRRFASKTGAGGESGRENEKPKVGVQVGEPNEFPGQIWKLKCVLGPVLDLADLSDFSFGWNSCSLSRGTPNATLGKA